MKHLQLRRRGGLAGLILGERPLRRISTLVVLLVVAAVGVTFLRDRSTTLITAYFSSATGLYEEDEVKVLGVKVGTIKEIDPQGDRVKVVLAVDSGTPIPDGAQAAIVAPSLVSGRFVQLAPAWTAGPRLQDGAEIGLDKTAVPVSFDDVKRQLTDLSVALGPQGADRQGALARAISTVEENLSNGNSTQLRSSIGSLREAVAALSDKRSDLFATVENLNSFTQNLLVNDAAVVAFNRQLDSVSAILNDNRTQLTGTVRELATLMTSLDRFFTTNGDQLAASIRQSAELSDTLANQANDIAAVLHAAPHALVNLYYSLENKAITGRVNLNNLDSVATLVCGALLSVGGAASQCEAALAPLLKSVGLSAVPGSAADNDLGDNGGPGDEQTPDNPLAELGDQLGANGSGPNLLSLLGLGGAK